MSILKWGLPSAMRYGSMHKEVRQVQPSGGPPPAAILTFSLGRSSSHFAAPATWCQALARWLELSYRRGSEDIVLTFRIPEISKCGCGLQHMRRLEKLPHTRRFIGGTSATCPWLIWQTAD